MDGKSKLGNAMASRINGTHEQNMEALRRGYVHISSGRRRLSMNLNPCPAVTCSKSQAGLYPAGTSKEMGSWMLNQIGTRNIFGPVVIVSVRGHSECARRSGELERIKLPVSSLIVG
jgi:hypothetical protein